jgi:hypothetical protein
LGWGLKKLQATCVQALVLTGTCYSLRDLPKKFPRLTRLSVDEPIARATAGDFRPVWTDMAVEIRTESEPALDWLRDSHASCVLRLNRPIGLQTKSVFLLQRVQMPADGLRPALLASANALRWLQLWVDQPQPAEWYRELRDVVHEALPQLVTLELMTEDDYSSLMSSSGRRQALALLNRLIQDPMLLGRQPSGNLGKE